MSASIVSVVPSADDGASMQKTYQELGEAVLTRNALCLYTQWCVKFDQRQPLARFLPPRVSACSMLYRMDSSYSLTTTLPTVRPDSS